MNEIQSLIEPSEILPGELLLSSETSKWGGLLLERYLQPPAELETPPLAKHLIFTLLSAAPSAGQTPNQIARFDGKQSEGAVKPGDIFFLPAGISAFCGWTATEDKAALIIEPDFLRQTALEWFEINPNRVEVVGSNWVRDEQIAGITNLLLRELERPAGVGGKLFAESLVAALSVHLLQRYCAFAPPRAKKYSSGLAPNRLRRVLDFIHANLETEFALRQLAAVAEVSEFHFARQFKLATGFAPYQFVLKTRVNEAKRLLTETTLSVAEIALRVGFSGQSKLAVHFRRQLGVAPNEYRKMFGKKIEKIE